jgi:parallel beta-helix repeat protein
VEKDNIVVDGAGHSLQGNGTIGGLYIRATETGIDLTDRTNVTVKNMQINCYQYAILLDGSDNIIISGNTVIQNRQGISVTRSAYTSIRENNITRNYEGIFITASASNNKISGNNIVENSATGITLKNANGNVIFGNNISYNGNGGGDMSGIFIGSGSNNLIVGNILYNNLNGVSMSGSTAAIIAGNNITKCSQGIFGQNSSDTVIYMNNFNNTNPNEFTDEGINFWDNGTIGNYWSDYIQKYPNAKEKGTTGIWDTPYVITHFGLGEDNTYQFMETNNTDHYPLLIPVSNAAASALAEVLVMAHSPSPIPSSTGVLSQSTLVLFVSSAVVVIVIVLAAVAILRRRKKQTLPASST